MLFDTSQITARLLIHFVPTLISLSFHEFGHAAAAVALGDPTPREQGRLTINPLRHIDLFGTVILPVALVFLGQPAFGWAKPVVFTPYRFRTGVKMRWGIVLVSAAGPLMNLVLAASCAIGAAASGDSFIASELLKIGLYINVVLCLFNLLPVPPLDGSRVVGGLLPAPLARAYSALDQVAPTLLAILLFSGAADGLIHEPVVALAHGLQAFGRSVHF